MRVCPNCGQTLGVMSYSPTKSPFFPDRHLTICNDCLDEELRAANGEWELMEYICEWADVPFIPEQFTKVWNSTPEHCVSAYIKIFNAAEFSRIHWKDYQERWQKAIKENQEKLIHPIFNQEELERLRREWGSGYSDEDLYQLDSLYTGLKNSFGISDPASADNGHKLCKISKEIDRCIASGSQGIDKLVSSYQKIQAMGGFSSENAKDFNNFGSISELALYMEKTGWKKKFHNDEVHDVVDQTMKNIQSYNRRLYQNESTIGDQIDDVLAAKARMDAIEDKILDSEMDQFDVDAFKLDDEDSAEEFSANI